MSEATADRDVALDELERRLGYAFSDRELLRTALTHRSHGVSGRANNETLEFLGDAVVGLAVSAHLLRAWPAANEGRLSRRRAALVNAETLAAKGAALGLGPLLQLGRGEEKTGGRGKRSILAGTFEALLGAVFLDGGFVEADAVVARLFASDIAVEPGAEAGEFKTRLQELAQRLFRATPQYAVLRESGPDHARHFESRVNVAGRVLGSGSGESKKVAEQEAARQALELLEAEGAGEIRPEGGGSEESP